MSKHDSNPNRDPLDENVDELLAQMAAGKVITDEGAVSVEEIEARKPKPTFTGTELLDDGNPVPKPAEDPTIASDTPIADTGIGEAALAAKQAESPVEPTIPDGPISDSGAVISDEAAQPAPGADAQLAPESPSSIEGNPLENDGNTVVTEPSTPENNLGQIPSDSVNSAESAADGNGPDVTTASAPGGTEPSDADAVVAPASNAGSTEAGEPVPELADQLDSLLSGDDAAGRGTGEELAVESLEVEATESASADFADAPAETKESSGTIESLNAELEAAAAKVESNDASAEAPAATQVESERVAAHPTPAQPATESVAATQTLVETPAAKAHEAAPAAKIEPATPPTVVEPKDPSAIQKLKAKVVAVAGNAALSGLALASSPLKNATRSTRDTIGWVGLWTAFLGVCVWFYVLVLHTPAPPFVPAAAIRMVENSAEGGEGGGHGEKPAKKGAAKKEEGHAKAGGEHEKAAAKPAKKAEGHEAPGGGHDKPKAAAKPAAKPAPKPGAKPAKKAEGHGESGEH